MTKRFTLHAWYYLFSKLKSLLGISTLWNYVIKLFSEMSESTLFFKWKIKNSKIWSIFISSPVSLMMFLFISSAHKNFSTLFQEKLIQNWATLTEFIETNVFFKNFFRYIIPMFFKLFWNRLKYGETLKWFLIRFLISYITNNSKHSIKIMFSKLNPKFKWYF